MSEQCCCENTCCEAGSKDDSIMVAGTRLVWKDKWGAFKARLGIGRMDYKVEPGIYAVGNPDEESPVLVSANYKLTFDCLRKELGGLDCWLLILDTKGVNVWCAAGKGTFGTEELVLRLEKAGLREIVNHRRLILPQLGAPGVSAHKVTKLSGFEIIYGPVRAEDIKAFISSGHVATKEMRSVNFTTKDRIAVSALEMVNVAKISLIIFGVLFLLGLFIPRQFDLYDVAIYVGAALTGSFFTPLLLPFIPGRAFAFKGWLLGLIWTVFALWYFGWFTAGLPLLVIGYLLLLPSLSGFISMNFTGCSTYTSPSGVLKEMKMALPPIVVSIVAGTVLVLLHHILG